MPTDQLVLLLVVAIIANVALMAAVLFLPARAGGEELGRTPLPPEPGDVAVQVAERQRDLPEGRTGSSGEVYDRVIRVVSYAFLAVVAVVTTGTDLYRSAAPPIIVVLVVGAVFLLLVHDVLPPTVFGPGRFVLEGSAAIAVITVLVALTGGADSPFFFGYLLVVAGAALVVRAGTAAIAAAVISLVYLLAVASLPGNDRLTFEQLVRLAINVLALWFIAYLASVVAREQRRTRDAALRLSLYDPLTQLYNRNYFFAVMDREIQRAARTGRRFCLVMIDMDDLKPINDTFGHHYGDRVLREVAEVIRRGIRVVDSAARYGGDEFVVLLPETDPTGAFVVAEKLREVVSRIKIPTERGTIQASVSIGVVAFPDDGETGDQLMISADAAMYESKRRGKNRVVAHSGDRTPERGEWEADEPDASAMAAATAGRPRRTTRHDVGGDDGGHPGRARRASGTVATAEKPHKSGAAAGGASSAPRAAKFALPDASPGPRQARKRTTRVDQPGRDPRPSTPTSRPSRKVPAGTPRPRRFPVVLGDEDVRSVMRHFLGPDRPADGRLPEGYPEPLDESEEGAAPEDLAARREPRGVFGEPYPTDVRRRPA